MRIKLLTTLLIPLFLAAGCDKQRTYTDNFSGVWTGPITFEENINNPGCSYEGTVTFEVPEPPNQQTGKFTLDLTKVSKAGTSGCWSAQKFPTRTVPIQASGDFITWNDSIVKFQGTTSLDTMIVQFESCPGMICSDGVKAKGIKGSGSLER